MTLQKIKVVSVNTAEKPGIKTPVTRIEIFSTGIHNDANAGLKNQQIRLLDIVSIENYSKKTRKNYIPGEFSENITTYGLLKCNLQPLDRLQGENVELEITQNKLKNQPDQKIHSILESELLIQDGFLSRITQAGELKSGEFLSFVQKVFHISVISLNPLAGYSFAEDTSSEKLQMTIRSLFLSLGRKVQIDFVSIACNEQYFMKEVDVQLNKKPDVLFTLGGTGIGPWDFVPEVMKTKAQKELNLLSGFLIMHLSNFHPETLLNRHFLGTSNKTLIYCLPNSVHELEIYLQEINKTLIQAIYKMNDL